MGSKIRNYAAVFFIVLLGISNSGWAMDGPVDISQKKEQSEAVTVFTPILTGLKDSDVESSLNQMLSGDVDRALDKFLLKWNEQRQKPAERSQKAKFFADYSEKFNRNGILSITVQQYSYIDKVHTEKLVNAYTVDVNTGKVYNLFQVFRPFVDYSSRLQEIIKNESELRRAKYSVKRLKDTQSFYLTEEGLVIYFQPYEISPKQTEIIRFVIPYEMIKDILNPELAI